jgi:quercetin dioxygenase-like cupin family protein
VGISAVELGNVSLGTEFPGIEDMNGRQLRMRLWTIKPGGIVPLHSHAGRPAIMYILEGAILEHRDDQDEPILHEGGGISKESGGVTHWWQNEGDVDVKLVAVDIFNAEPTLNGTVVN